MKNRSNLDQVREHGEAIAQRSTDPRVSNTMMQLATKYQTLATAAKVGNSLRILGSLGVYPEFISCLYKYRPTVQKYL